MAALHGTKALETWCRLVTDGYANVNIVNMSTSWRSGLGFCAIIHKFRPELILFDALDPDDAFANNELAFTTAEQHLGIPALLDPQDMVEAELLDRLSILTYLSQFYQSFHGATGPCKEATPTKLRYITAAGSNCSSGSSTPSRSSRSMLPGGVGRRSELCKICTKPVFILERLNVAGTLLHRTCFKCARCNNQLSIANYYETEAGLYCCDMCPDEELSQAEVAEANKKLVQDHMEFSADEEDSLPESLQVDAVKQVEAVSSEAAANVVKEAVPLPECDQHEEVTTTTDNQDDKIAQLDDDKAEQLVTETEQVFQTETEKVEQPQVQEEAEVEQPPQTESEQPLTEAAEQPLTEAEQPSREAEESKTETEQLKTETEQPETEVEQPQTEAEQPKTEMIQLIGKLEIFEAAEKLLEVAEASAEKLEEIHPQSETVKEEQLEETDEKQTREASKQPQIHVEQPPETDQEKQDLDKIEDVEKHQLQPDVEQLQQQVEETYPDDLNPFGDEDSATNEAEKIEVEIEIETSTNPFGDHEDSLEEVQAGQVQGPPKPPRLSLNPFGSDFEDEDDEPLKEQPPRRAPPRKKRHAPPPPSPSATSTPTPAPRLSLRPPPRPPPPGKDRIERDNINRRSQIMEDNDDDPSMIVELTPMSPDKSNLEGKWKKKKGPAPPRPIPPKRQVRKLPRKAVNTELVDIEIKQQELETQGVDLEKTIRQLCEKGDLERTEAGLDNNDRDSLGPEAEDLIVQLFELVNEKNELYRRQTELMYMKREHRLEEEHADIEHQIRVLMAKPDALRTDDDKVKEDKLIERLMSTVSQRNEIVDCLEMDRLRELEEDESIEIHMGEYAAIKPLVDDVDMTKKKKEKKKKEKKKKKKDKAYDADKDIDTSEFPSGGASLSNSPRPSPKKSPMASLGDKDKAKKFKKKLLSSLKPITMKRL